MLSNKLILTLPLNSEACVEHRFTDTDNGPSCFLQQTVESSNNRRSFGYGGKDGFGYGNRYRFGWEFESGFKFGLEFPTIKDSENVYFMGGSGRGGGHL